LRIVWLVYYRQKPKIKKQGSAHKGWRSSTLAFLWAGGNAERKQGNELRPRSAVPCLHAHKATAKGKQPVHWIGLSFGRKTKFERGRLRVSLALRC
jgi:hypothetical protein